jgi:flagellar basal-body rod modification protein FlgD
MSIAFHPAMAGSSPANSKPEQSSAASSATDNKTVFLQLLVNELKNQDPLNPVQGTEFVTQLAQFQQLEQTITTGEDITGIHSDLDQIGAMLQAQSSAGTHNAGKA